MYAVGDNGAIIKNVNTIGIENIVGEKLMVFPNPADECISIPVNGKMEVSLLNLQGGLIKTKIIEDEEVVNLDVIDQPNGTYIVRAMINGKGYYARVIISHH